MNYSAESEVEREKYIKLYERNYGRLTPMLKYRWATEVYNFIGDDPQNVVDFGCGSGVPAKMLEDRGHTVQKLDFAPNAGRIFGDTSIVEVDITDPNHMAGITGDVGICLDVMEHIPRSLTEAALENMSNAVPRCYFSIAIEDFGPSNEGIHITMHDTLWWKTTLSAYFHVTKLREHTNQRTSGLAPTGVCILVEATSR